MFGSTPPGPPRPPSFPSSSVAGSVEPMMGGTMLLGQSVQNLPRLPVVQALVTSHEMGYAQPGGGIDSQQSARNVYYSYKEIDSEEEGEELSDRSRELSLSEWNPPTVEQVPPSPTETPKEKQTQAGSEAAKKPCYEPCITPGLKAVGLMGVALLAVLVATAIVGIFVCFGLIPLKPEVGLWMSVGGFGAAAAVTIVSTVSLMLACARDKAVKKQLQLDDASARDDGMPGLI